MTTAWMPEWWVGRGRVSVSCFDESRAIRDLSIRLLHKISRHFQLCRNSVLSTFSTRVEFTDNLYGIATSRNCPVKKRWHHDGGIPFPFSLEQQCCASFVAMLNRATGWNNNQQYSYTNNWLSIMTGKGEHIRHDSRHVLCCVLPSWFV
jgi:hypothetical protein